MDPPRDRQPRVLAGPQHLRLRQLCCAGPGSVAGERRRAGAEGKSRAEPILSLKPAPHSHSLLLAGRACSTCCLSQLGDLGRSLPLAKAGVGVDGVSLLGRQVELPPQTAVAQCPGAAAPVPIQPLAEVPGGAAGTDPCLWASASWESRMGSWPGGEAVGDKVPGPPLFPIVPFSVSEWVFEDRDLAGTEGVPAAAAQLVPESQGQLSGERATESSP